MQRGYVKLWRKSLDSGLLQNHKLWVFWTWCLMKATHKKTKQMVGMQIIELEPGQFIFGRKKAAAETGLSEQSVRTCVIALEDFGNITINPTNKFSVVTVVNWDAYQQEDVENNQQTNHQLTSSQPAANHKQEHKNIRNNTPLNPPKGKIDVLKDYLQKNIPESLKPYVLKILEFYKYRQQKPKAKRYQTEKMINGLFRNLGNCAAAGYDINTCLDIAMENGWQTPSVNYYKPEMFNSTPITETKEDILKRHGLAS